MRERDRERDAERERQRKRREREIILSVDVVPMWKQAFLSSDRDIFILQCQLSIFSILLGSPLAVAKAALTLPGVHTEIEHHIIQIISPPLHHNFTILHY